MDNCCLHHKETLKNHDVASLVIAALVEKRQSVDQPNKVFAYVIGSIIELHVLCRLLRMMSWESRVNCIARIKLKREEDTSRFLCFKWTGQKHGTD